MDTGIIIPFIFFLVVASAFFSASETGLTVASRAKIYKLKLSGNRNAERVSRLREQKERLISVILFGNNAVNILASSLATSIAIAYYGEQGVLYATVVITIITVIFSEVLPKTYALYHAEEVALKCASLMTFLVRILSPITVAAQVMVNAMLWGLGKGSSGKEEFSAEELRGTIELHHHEGKMFKRERDMLGSILDLSETEVSQVMVHRKNMISINLDLPTADIITEVLDNAHTRIPLWREKPENILGILHVKALLQALRSHSGDIKDLDIMSIATEPWFIPETTTLYDQLFRFRKRRNHMAMVVDEYGDLVGLITLEDILEEIVGHIYDEYDESEIAAQKIMRLKSGAIKVNGELSIRDLNRAMGWDLPDTNADTVAGLIMHEAETIPSVGQEFEFHHRKYKILKKKRNQITSVQITKALKNK